MATPSTISISYTPTKVTVSRPDGDEQADGHRVVVTFPDGRTVTGDRIEPEGPSRDAWLDGGLERLCDPVIKALRDMATEVDALEDLTISEVMALLPEGVDWRIVNSFEARGKTSDGRPWIIYWDDTPGCLGWAYQIVGDVEHPAEGGPLDTATDLANVFS